MNKFFITILFLFSSLISSFSFAADDGDWWLQRQLQIGDGKNQYGKKVYGKAARTVMEDVPLADGTSSRVEQMIKRSIAVDKPTATKVGGSMFKRVSAYAKNPGIQMIGVLAVTQLLEAIGWVMEDGAYVKYKEPEVPDNEYDYKAEGYDSCNPDWSRSAGGAADNLISSCSGTDFYGVGYKLIIYSAVVKGTSPNYYLYIDNAIQRPDGSVYNRTRGDVGLQKRPTNLPDDKKDKTVLTPALLGAAMLGTGYKDPDPNFDNDTVNTGDYTGVKETYEHDPSGVGDELADDMDDKLKNAPPTDDAKPSWIGDSKYDDRPLSDDRDDSSDRSWDEKGDEATGSTEPTKDPETGEATGGQSITIQFPLFCSWASKMCQWYDDWKASDKIHQKFEEDVKNHQSDEKSFWQTVKDWFDWSKKDDDLPERDETDLITELPIEQKTKNINWSAQCPTAQTVPINFHGVTAEITVADFSYLCSLDWLIKPFVIAFASISAAFIIFGFNRGGDDG